jgi:hypothetical protein
MQSISLQVTLCLLYSNCGDDSSPIFAQPAPQFHVVTSTARRILSCEG